MEDFDIDEIREEINGLSNEEKLNYLEDKRNEIEELIKDLQDNISDLDELEDEIESEKDEKKERLSNHILQTLEEAGYHIELEKGYPSISLGKIDLFFMMLFGKSKVELIFKTAEIKLWKYSELISSILPDFHQDQWTVFSRVVPEEEFDSCIVDAVRKLMDNKQRFEELCEG